MTLSCFEYANEDIINVACECFESCLLELTTLTPKICDQLRLHAWSCLERHSSGNMEENQWLGGLIKILSLVNRTAPLNISPERLAILLKFLKVDTPSDVFEAVVLYLKSSSTAFG